MYVVAVKALRCMLLFSCHPDLQDLKCPDYDYIHHKKLMATNSPDPSPNCSLLKTVSQIKHIISDSGPQILQRLR